MNIENNKIFQLKLRLKWLINENLIFQNRIYKILREICLFSKNTLLEKKERVRDERCDEINPPKNIFPPAAMPEYLIEENNWITLRMPLGLYKYLYLI